MAVCYDVQYYPKASDLNVELSKQSVLDLPDMLLLEVDENEECFSVVNELKKKPHLQGLIILLLAKCEKIEWRTKALAAKVHDFYVYPFNVHELNERIQSLIKFRILRPWYNDNVVEEKELNCCMPLSKRIFDITFSLLILIFLSPLFLLIALTVYLESGGPIIYRSKRVGTGYKVFDFYKFRSMRVGADAEVATLLQNNLYAATQEGGSKATFFKMANDPRVTKVGQFLRDTSLDELPQIFNILIGDMSFVGNRPLPLYEAEMLTSDEWSMRFLGPAGLTGLWQITKRGKKDVSEQERKEMDNFYAQSCSFWLDMKILLKTFPALFQKEKV
jgi:lipopolysaccharide/colanic/teichoic acid biosynthesis glycosyltransferase